MNSAKRGHNFLEFAEMKKKQLHISVETLAHKWPVFGIGFVKDEFFVCLWLVDVRIWRDFV
jgi:hypothetical protein